MRAQSTDYAGQLLEVCRFLRPSPQRLKTVNDRMRDDEIRRMVAEEVIKFGNKFKSKTNQKSLLVTAPRRKEFALSSALRRESVEPWFLKGRPPKHPGALFYALVNLGERNGLSPFNSESPYHAALRELARSLGCSGKDFTTLFDDLSKHAVSEPKYLAAFRVVTHNSDLIDRVDLKLACQRYEGFWMLYRLRSMEDVLVRDVLYINGSEEGDDLPEATLLAKAPQYDAKGTGFPTADHLFISLFHPIGHRLSSASMSFIQLHRLEVPSNRWSLGIFAGTSRDHTTALVARHVLAKKLEFLDKDQLRRFKAEPGEDPRAYKQMSAADVRAWFISEGKTYLPSIAKDGDGDIIRILRHDTNAKLYGGPTNDQLLNLNPLYVEKSLAAAFAQSARMKESNGMSMHARAIERHVTAKHATPLSTKSRAK